MIRLKTSAFALITLMGVPIGANNMIEFQQGLKPLDNRAEYCEWIGASDQTDSEPRFYPTASQGILYPTVAEEVYDRLWRLPQKLRPYQNKKILFTYLPQPVRTQLNKTLIKYQKKLNQIEDTLSILVQNTYKLKNNKSEDQNERRYQQWKLNQDFPNQIAHLNAAQSELQRLIADLKQKRLDNLQAHRFSRQAFSEDIHIKGIKTHFLALELEYQPGIWKESVHLYPIWVEGNQITRASKEPYFSVHGDMVPSGLGRSLRESKLPKLFQLHSNLMLTPPLSGENSEGKVQPQQKHSLAKVQILSKYRLLIKGTSYSNPQPALIPGDKLDQLLTNASYLAVDSLLDLGCMQNSRWAQKLVKNTEKFLTNPQLKKTYVFESIDPHSLQVLETLKTLNSPAQRSIPQVHRPTTLWKKLLAAL